jgi:diadenosine tetraphosphate (Ap4A) HIT family hydrolase
MLWSDARLRVIAVDDADYPGYTRVVWKAHVAEMSDLAAGDRGHLLGVVNVVEEELRALMRPDKVNLASFGNMVPHLHWHVIPRFADDPHFPQSNWGVAQRARDDAATLERGALARQLGERLVKRLGG